MPSPVGHTLVGYILYKFWDKGQHKLLNWKNVLLVFIFANFPDIDFLPGIVEGSFNKYHFKMTHSLGFLVFSSVIVIIFLMLLKVKQKIFWFSLFFSCYAAHLFLDLFAKDTVAPYGMMLFWPFSGKTFASPVFVFSDIHHGANWINIFCWHNLKSICMELAIIIPVLVICLWLKNRKTIIKIK